MSKVHSSEKEMARAAVHLLRGLGDFEIAILAALATCATGSLSAANVVSRAMAAGASRSQAFLTDSELVAAGYVAHVRGYRRRITLKGRRALEAL